MRAINKHLYTSLAATALLAGGIVTAPSAPTFATSQSQTAYSIGLKGLGDYQFASIKIDNNTLTLTANGQPHSYFNKKLYAEVSVTRAGKKVFDQEFIGSQNYKLNQTFSLENGDQIQIWHAEPSRIAFNNAPTSTIKTKAYTYEYQAGQLTNVTDQLYYQNQVKNLTKANGDLALGLTQGKINTVKNNINNDNDLTADQKSSLLAKISDIQTKFDALASYGAISLNTSYTKTGYVLPPQTQSNQQGRVMGTNQDMQALGLVLQNGATIRVRQVNAKYKLPCSIKMIGDTNWNYQVKYINNNWTEITAKGDQIPFIWTEKAKNDDYTQPQVEWQVVSGNAKELPVYTRGSNQTAFVNQWDKEKTSFALINGNNFQIVVPQTDIQKVANLNLDSLISDYDDKLFPFYNEIAGYHTNTSLDDHTKAKYLIVPDANGYGVAYYNPSNVTGQNGKSVSSFLNMNWLVFHEIGHGYELHASDMYTPESFNNIFATLFQLTYYPEAYKAGGDSWLFTGNEWPHTTAAIQQFKQNIEFNKLDYHNRLYWWLNLAYNLEGKDSFKEFNTFYNELAAKGLKHDQMGNNWLRFYIRKYQLNIVPYLKQVGLPLDSVAVENAEKLPAIAMLYQVLPDDYLTNQAKFRELLTSLGQQDNLLATRVMAVTNATLSKAKLNSNVTLKLDPAELAKVQGNTLEIKDGSKLIKSVQLNSETTDLGTLPNGIYYLSLKTSGANIDNPYLYVKDNNQTSSLTFTGKASVETSPQKAAAKENEAALKLDLTKVVNADKLTDEEKAAVKSTILTENPNTKIKEVVVKDNGQTTITFEDGSQTTLNPNKVIISSKSGQALTQADNQQTLNNINKVVVTNLQKLSDSEKEAVKNAILVANTDKLIQNVEVADDGQATVTFKDNTQSTLAAANLITKKEDTATQETPAGKASGESQEATSSAQTQAGQTTSEKTASQTSATSETPKSGEQENTGKPGNETQISPSSKPTTTQDETNNPDQAKETGQSAQAQTSSQNEQTPQVTPNTASQETANKQTEEATAPSTTTSTSTTTIVNSPKVEKVVTSKHQIAKHPKISTNKLPTLKQGSVKSAKTNTNSRLRQDQNSQLPATGSNNALLLVNLGLAILSLLTLIIALIIFR